VRNAPKRLEKGRFAKPASTLRAFDPESRHVERQLVVRGERPIAGTLSTAMGKRHFGRAPSRREILRIRTLFIAAAAMTMPAAAGAQAPAADHTQHQAPAAGASATDAGASTAATASVGPVEAATAADIKTGAAVMDQKGGSVGTIESVTAEGAVIATGKAKVQIPLGSFGKSSSGLVIGMTKTELEAAAAKGS
jgi:hypothetical protein